MQLVIKWNALSFQSLPVAVVVIFVVASQGGEATQADGIGEEDLSSSIHPYLRTEKKQNKENINIYIFFVSVFCSVDFKVFHLLVKKVLNTLKVFFKLCRTFIQVCIRVNFVNVSFFWRNTVHLFIQTGFNPQPQNPQLLCYQNSFLWNWAVRAFWCTSALTYRIITVWRSNRTTTEPIPMIKDCVRLCWNNTDFSVLRKILSYQCV